MVRFENGCVGCPPEMGCLGNACPNRNIAHTYCDNCECEEELYDWYGEELCLDCILKECDEDVDEYELRKSVNYSALKY